VVRLSTSTAREPSARQLSLRELRLRAVRARIADVASVAAAPAALGSVRLRPHQQLAVARVADALARYGGCLLSDDVGRGKTYVALAVARRWTRPLVVVPASLRGTWQRAMERARVSCAVVTHEALSRGALPAPAPDGVIVDESHRFRSPAAKRHAALARITSHAPVLLLSATPLQNRTRDLAAQLAFFLGSSAYRSSDAALARHVVRSSAAADDSLPDVAPPLWLQTAHDDGAVLRAILALPPPARPFDAGDAGALRTITLVRAWASSRAALSSALRRRMRALTALEQCAVNGLAPSSRDLRAWHGGDGDVQLALAPLLVTRTVHGRVSDLLAAVESDRAGVGLLSTILRASPDPDLARVDALRRLRAEHPGARILAFSEFATTVRAYYALLRADSGIGMLTASEARIASGRLPRDSLLARFAPGAHGAREPVERERVTLLLATDVLSEGMNLQDANVVVHLDLPWNPARLAQRVGRVRRPGGAAVVHSYLMSPPATTELLLRVEQRLRAKLARAERAIGRAIVVMPTLYASSVEGAALLSAAGAADTRDEPSAEGLGEVFERIAGWQRRHATARQRVARAPLVAAAIASEEGWLAALDDGRLFAQHGAPVVSAGSGVVRAVAAAMGPGRPCSARERQHALAALTAHLEGERLRITCGVRDDAAPLDGVLERRLAAAIRRTPRHRRTTVLALAARLRAELVRPMPLGAERELHALLESVAPDGGSDIDWLERAIAVLGRDGARQAELHRPRVVALVVFGPESLTSATTWNPSTGSARTPFPRPADSSP